MLFKSRDEKRIFGIMNFQKKSRNGNEKKYLREFDALEMLLETVAKFGKRTKCRNVPPLFLEIDNNSEFLTTNTNLFLWKSF